MHYRKFLLIFLFFFICTKSFSAVFVVTSNADSGAGTLRDALTQAAANDSTQTDYINFNLPGSTLQDRTIILLSQLPNVSSNLVIDGTTQPGGGLNMGDAGVNITLNRFDYVVPSYSTGGLVITNVSNVQIYGLSINGFYFLRNNFQGGATTDAGLLISNSQNVTIGAPGKGNYLQNNNNDIYADISALANNNSTNLKIQSNYFGYQAGILSYLPYGLYLRGNNILFGGDGALEGNHLLGVMTIYGINIQLVHNLFGVDSNGNPLTMAAQINCGGNVPGTSNIVIRNNLWNNLNVSMLNVNNFQIYANTDFGYYIGTVGLITTGLSLVWCSNGIIGSNDITQENIIHSTNTNVGIGNQDSNNIQILKNSITCSDIPYQLYIETNVPITIPDIKVLISNNTEFSGTASPNSTIYIFQDTTDCPICNPVKFYTTVIADASGVWKITGDFTGEKLLANALLNQNSSEYTDPRIPDDYLNGVLSMPSCGQYNGSIIIKDASNTLRFEWYNSNNVKVGEGAEIQNIGPGSYYAIGFTGNCSVRSAVFYLYNVQPQIIDQNLKIINPSCGKGGAITGLITTANSQDPLTYIWTDQSGNIVGNNPDINNLPAGKYLFTLTDTVTKCVVNYGPISLINTTGPNIDQSQALIQSTNCGQSTGSITNITATGTGTLKYVWLNSQQQQVGTDINLLNQPAGTYKLQVTDDTQCGPVFSTDMIIPETNGITMDESAVQTTMATCGKDIGSITGIKVTGASEYYWTYGNNKLTTTTPDLLNVAAGDYTLTASNSYGCIKTSLVYHIANPPPTNYPSYSVGTQLPCFGKANGSITVSVDNLATAERWVNTQGETIGTAPELTNVATGTYQLYLTDKNGCETSYGAYNLQEIPQLLIATGSELITNDQCSLKEGSITNIQVTGGTPPYTYSWLDDNNNVISSSPDLTAVMAGTYTFNVNDVSGCGSAMSVYAVQDQDNIIPPPSISNVQVCSPGAALLQVNNASKTYTYRLYDSPTSTIPLDELASGIFKVTAKENTSYYVSQVSGSCESVRAEVKVSVGLSSVDIANAFTPNGDGINDYWKITGIEDYPNALVQVFTRYGQKIFESKGYTKPFDGTYNGKQLPVGVYYFIINLSTNCNLLTGSLTIIR